MFITHDLSLVKAISDRVYVMYLGKIVEQAKDPGPFFTSASSLHRGLAAINPDPRPRRPAQDPGRRRPIALYVPIGCVFQGRCPYVQAYMQDSAS